MTQERWDQATPEGRAFYEHMVAATTRPWDPETEAGRQFREHMRACGKQRFDPSTEQGLERRQKAREYALTQMDNGGRGILLQRNATMYDPNTEKGRASRAKQSIVQKALRDPSNPRSAEIKMKAVANHKATHKANRDLSTPEGRMKSWSAGLNGVKKRIQEADTNKEFEKLDHHKAWLNLPGPDPMAMFSVPRQSTRQRVTWFHAHDDNAFLEEDELEELKTEWEMSSASAVTTILAKFRGEYIFAEAMIKRFIKEGKMAELEIPEKSKAWFDHDAW